MQHSKNHPMSPITNFIGGAIGEVTKTLSDLGNEFINTATGNTQSSENSTSSNNSR